MHDGHPDSVAWRDGHDDIVSSQSITHAAERLKKRYDVDGDTLQALLDAADSLCHAARWLVMHLAFSRCVRLDGVSLPEDELLSRPRINVDNALALVPVYVGYLLVNALSGTTRAWALDQGHHPAAILAVDALAGNLPEPWRQRYSLTDEGLSRICRDLDEDPDAAGRCVAVGSWPRMTGLQYVHEPLPGQTLVALLDRDSFDRQRGSDRAPLWWRGEDTGIVVPVMFGSDRADVDWLSRHLRLNGFDPVRVSGQDPGSFSCLIMELSDRLQCRYERIRRGLKAYPVRMPFGLAEPPARLDPVSPETLSEQINDALSQMHVAPGKLRAAVACLEQRRPRGCHQDLKGCRVSLPERPIPQDALPGAVASPLIWVDEWFCRLAESNPSLRIRVGDMTGSRICRMNRTEDVLHRRAIPASGGSVAGSPGSVIAALDEEAVISAVFANRQGFGLAICRETRSMQLYSAMRQEVECARQLVDRGKEVPWLSVPVMICSTAWEGDGARGGTALSEVWMEERADLAPMLFPFDANTAVATLDRLYAQRGQVAVVMCHKATLPVILDGPAAAGAVENGAVTLRHDPDPALQLIAVGPHQLQAVLTAADALRAHGVSCSVAAMIEPGRFRIPRTRQEAGSVHDDARLDEIIPPARHRLFVSHTRAEPLAGVLRRLDTGPERCRFLGHLGCGGATDVSDMQFRNQQSWAHIVRDAARMLGTEPKQWLAGEQLAALDGQESPDILR